jgi:hypothetical protein
VVQRHRAAQPRAQGHVHPVQPAGVSATPA